MGRNEEVFEFVQEIYGNHFSDGEVEFVTEEQRENRVGFTHTNIAIARPPETATLSEVKDLSDAFSDNNLIANIDESDDGFIIHIQHTYDVMVDLGLIEG